MGQMKSIQTALTTQRVGAHFTSFKHESSFWFMSQGDIHFTKSHPQDYSPIDEEPLISGTAQEEEINERAMKSWRDLLDSWTDSTTRPPGLVKLARKVSKVAHALY